MIFDMSFAPSSKEGQFFVECTTFAQEPYFYTFADEEDLELVTSCDSRRAGEAVVEDWNADDDFPWSVKLHFPTADQVLKYEIETWFYEGTDENRGALGFWVSLRPLYVRVPEPETLLSLQIMPSGDLNYDLPQINFHSEQKAVCQIDLAKQAINIMIQFGIVVDLEQGSWRYAKDDPCWANSG